MIEKGGITCAYFVSLRYYLTASVRRYFVISLVQTKSDLIDIGAAVLKVELLIRLPSYFLGVLGFKIRLALEYLFFKLYLV